MEDNTPSGPPTPDPLPMPGNPWPELKRRATRSKDPLMFEQQAAYELAKAAAETITQLRTLQWGTRSLMNLSPFSDLPSGEALAAKLSDRGTEMYRIIDAHLSILQDMMDTFIAAGKHYDAGEQENEALFDKVEARFIKTDYPTLDTKVPEIKVEKDKLFGDVGDVSKRLRESNDFLPSTVWGESKRQEWNRLYRLGDYLKRNYSAKLAAEASGIWKWMGDRIQPTFTELLNRVDSVTADQWSGPGAETAVAAIKQYADGIKPLRKSMYLVQDNLIYTAGWLGKTAENTPPQAKNPADSDPKQTDWLPLYQDLFGNYYTKGVERSAARVPPLVYPDASFKALPPLGKVTKKGKKVDHTSTTDRNTPQLATGAPDSGGAGPDLASSSAPYSGGGAPGQPGPMPGYPGPDQAASQRAIDAAAGRRDADLAAYQRDQQAAMRQQAALQRQAADRAEQQALQQAAQQQAAQAAQAAQQALQAGQQAAQQQAAAERLAGLPGVPSVPGAGLDPKSGAPKLGGGISGSGAPGTPLNRDLSQAAKLFPRASSPVTAAGAPMAMGRAGMAPMAGAPGSPGAAGAAGRGAGDGNNQQKRPAYLESADHLEEALGEAPRVVRPVVEK
ncbi:hypothetical protein [Nocardia grenadensis]|uniref:hypothetical protein n=1 Tax=Nocardia grenadensis TaxID=931537 RepID=UPI003D8ACE62